MPPVGWEVHSFRLLRTLTEGGKIIKATAKEMLNIVCDNISFVPPTKYCCKMNYKIKVNVRISW